MRRLHAVNTTACVLALALCSPIASVMPMHSSQALEIAQAGAAPTTTLTAAQATRAARELLEALKAQDAAGIYAGLSAPLRNTTNEQAVRTRLRNRPSLSDYRISAISRGMDDTTVEAVAVLADGKKEAPLLLVLDNEGKLVAWKWVGTTLPIEQSALNFVQDLNAERWVAARSYLDLDFQKEIGPQDLKRKWSKLSRVLGGTKQIKSALVASQGGEQQLVLVTIEFGKVTDNLFVIFNREGRIINVDFSADLV
ncbi:DUF3887 domain-containing protein [Synechococcus sp. UW140]|uniref:DUF3887 domain-containing protein n=1 Tax=Synechococcus sp. UW140 TaxID=368503 RepID=UPI000E0F635A